MKKPRTNIAWGSAEFLCKKFDDIDNAVELSKKTKAFKYVKSMVDELDAARTKAYVYKVYRCEGKVDNNSVKFHIAQIAMGLNGNGLQADYYKAIAKLLGDHQVVSVIDVGVDACDDLVDFLIQFE